MKSSEVESENVDSERFGKEEGLLRVAEAIDQLPGIEYVRVNTEPGIRQEPHVMFKTIPGGIEALKKVNRAAGHARNRTSGLAVFAQGWPSGFRGCFTLREDQCKAFIEFLDEICNE